MDVNSKPTTLLPLVMGEYEKGLIGASADVNRGNERIFRLGLPAGESDLTPSINWKAHGPSDIYISNEDWAIL